MHASTEVLIDAWPSRRLKRGGGGFQGMRKPVLPWGVLVSRIVSFGDGLVSRRVARAARLFGATQGLMSSRAMMQAALRT